ncbi:MAG: transglycosylase SLT domain-containing protein [Bryobacteraceae bacterium]
MVRFRTYSRCLASLAVLLGLSGCVPMNSRQSLRTPLLPPRPAPPAPATLDPPVIAARLELADSPHLFAPPQSPARPTRADALIREAEWHYQAGRKQYQDGDQEGARREFDRAIDLLLTAPEDASSRAVADVKLEELVEAIHRLDLAGLGSGDTASEPVFERPPLEDLPQMTFPVDPKLKNKVLEELRATASQLPLQSTDAVLSYVNYFSTPRGRKMLIYGLRRAGRYRPLIQRIFDEEGVPQELIFLAQAESGFLPRALSRKRAAGMWQFVRLRGREYGLNQSPYADDRLDPEKATRAAARHLRDLYHRYGDWYLAIAAYNCGPVVIDRAVERTGYADFWELQRRNVLPKETSNYVPIILAMTIVVKNAREYGFEGIESDPPLEYDTLEVTAPTHLQLIADLTESPLSQIRDLNPALLRSVAPEGASVHVPKGSGNGLGAVLDKIPPQRRSAWRAHRVLEGERLSAIARRYRVTESSIVAASGALVGDLQPGDLLIIPAAPVRETAVVRRAAARRGVRHRAASSAAQSRRVASAAPHRAASRTAGGRPAASTARRAPAPAASSSASLAAPSTSSAAVKR